MGIISNVMLFRTKRARGLLLQKLMHSRENGQYTGLCSGSWAYSVGDHASLHVNIPKWQIRTFSEERI